MFEEAQRRVNHRAHLDETDEGAVFAVQTRSLGRVTELDLERASQIDQVVDKISSGG